MNIIKSSLKHHQISLISILIIFIAGIYSLSTMSRRSDPEITVRQALVVCYYPGAKAVQVEEQVTKQIEDKLFSYAEVKKDDTYSNSYDNMVILTVTLEDWVKIPDLFWERLGQGLIQLANTKLPDGVIGPIVNSDFGDVVALLIGVESEKSSYSEIQEYIGILENSIRRIPATSKIDKLGYWSDEIQVSTSSAKLAQYNIQLNDIIDILKSQNTIKYAGYIESDYSKINLHATGLFKEIDQLKNQQVGETAEGSIIRLKDIATVERIRQDPTKYIRVNGKESNTMLVSLQMQHGYNIVDYGKEVDKAIADCKKLLPSDLNITIINNQPDTVKKAVNDFLREFLIAVAAVILVIMLLLPFNIAMIASFAIPISVGMTFTFLNLFGFELQQVSLASLIVVLGMVVDDAVVVIDNYVSKLDAGMKRFDAAWKAASEFSMPMISSALTIIMSFLPLVFVLSGDVGEFLMSLPITIAIATTCSLIVAFFLTPFLAFLLIKKGLKKDKKEDESKKKKFSLLNIIQISFDKLIDFSMGHKKITLFIGLAVIFLGVYFMKFPKQSFFPKAQRDQFVIQVMEPMGTKLEITNGDIKKIEDILKKDESITSFSSFVGTSAPRVYYSFSPVFPQESYGMILVNTESADKTAILSAKYLDDLQNLLPNAQVDVMEFSQGAPTLSAVEVRISGDNHNELKRIGESVKNVLRNTDGTRLIVEDFKNNFFINVNVNDIIANQTGYTTEIIADLLAAGFYGAPLSTFWEGDDPIPITFRLDKESRENYNDIMNTYLGSPITGQYNTLRTMAEISPEWQFGMLTRRNGIPTLTVGAKCQNGYISSDIQAAVQPAIDTIQLKPGYFMEYGGVVKSKNKTFGEMVIALIISLVAIFIILLFVFKDIKRPLIIMISIPLTLFGSMLGLLITGNVFSFTAFVGLIALVGIVIRNGVIMVEYSDELVETEGLSRNDAALESAKRRLRPIFLTTMAAAIGVVPMIVLKDTLWAPLASVFAFGIVFSMIINFMVLPVFYAWFIKSSKSIENK
ncbi:MAG: efflux RND transporter permease subunit [Lentimicrobiaceae bacterium]|jgi:multidrug efflux pump subunit AcrB|nr:efflux RND transporter permease subunit [Lentimicrobiaceae bacterium]MCP4909161.1 efflux RND transporter permease subunit [Bacteroidota bacterium]MBT3455190.1 efflux RND transporter permease subunit [Lentimicrobiaceae bacterium]MBT3817848.1 efflux RND transporter permease subunit [Lentimicrobiaceae bacterium]MBT4061882.1 efflux RND transporter permease subunit [Lentimicrobiaceae bacterium]